MKVMAQIEEVVQKTEGFAIKTLAEPSLQLYKKYKRIKFRPNFF